MRCRQARRLFSLGLDGGSTARRTAELERHLAGCEECRLAAGRLERAWGALDRLPRPGAAPDDWPAILAGVEARRPWPPAWLDLGLAPSRAFTAAVLVAMAVLGGAGGILLGRAAPSSLEVSLEGQAVAETLGELPWNSPVAGLAPILDGSPPRRIRP